MSHLRALKLIIVSNSASHDSESPLGVLDVEELVTKLKCAYIFLPRAVLTPPSHAAAQEVPPRAAISPVFTDSTPPASSIGDEIPQMYLEYDELVVTGGKPSAPITHPRPCGPSERDVRRWTYEWSEEVSRVRNEWHHWKTFREHQQQVRASEEHFLQYATMMDNYHEIEVGFPLAIQLCLQAEQQSTLDEWKEYYVFEHWSLQQLEREREIRKEMELQNEEQDDFDLDPMIQHQEIDRRRIFMQWVEAQLRELEAKGCHSQAFFTPSKKRKAKETDAASQLLRPSKGPRVSAENQEECRPGGPIISDQGAAVLEAVSFATREYSHLAPSYFAPAPPGKTVPVPKKRRRTGKVFHPHDPNVSVAPSSLLHLSMTDKKGKNGRAHSSRPQNHNLKTSSQKVVRRSTRLERRLENGH